MLLRTIDIGNSFVKVLDFDGDHIIESTSFDIIDKVKVVHFLQDSSLDMLCICSVKTDFAKAIKEQINDLGMEYFELHKDTFPLKIDYKTPETLGADRLAASCGAYFIFKSLSLDKVIIVDSGTAITCDVLDSRDGIFEGGVIMSGSEVIYKTFIERASSLADFNLPKKDREVSFPAKSTGDCIGLGLRLQTEMAIENLLNEYIGRHKELNIRVVVTGGHGRHLNLNMIYDYEPDLVHIGLKFAFQKHIGEL